MAVAARNKQELPVIFIRDSQGNTVEKITVKEWMRREAIQQNDNFFIKLYREALNYYAMDDFEKAEDLLLYLCESTHYSHYEYVERLANIYRLEKRPDKERCILLLSHRQLRNDPICLHIDRRLEKLDYDFLPSNGLFNQAFGN